MTPVYLKNSDMAPDSDFEFESGSPPATRALYRKSVPVERLFMTSHETARMNERFKEAEAVLFFDGDDSTFWKPV